MWHQLVKQHNPTLPNSSVSLLGNKCDMEERRGVSGLECRNLARELTGDPERYVGISAKSMEGFDEFWGWKPTMTAVER